MELYAIDKNYVEPYLEAIENATLEQEAAAFSRFGDIPLPEIVTRDDATGKATITIKGPLSPAGSSPLARFFGYGGTGYIDIIEAAQSLQNDPAITSVDLAIDSPGGTVAGMDQARQALESLATEKTVNTVNNGMMASAAYYLGTVGAKIQAVSPLAVSGSIGIIMAGYDWSESLARDGIKKIRIVSVNAPNKQPDPATAEGRELLKSDANAIERVFISTIAEGRNTTTDDVIANFGKGGILIAQDPDPEKPDALKTGMIDSVVTSKGVMTLDDSENNTEELSNDASDSVTGGGDVAPVIAAKGGEQLEGTVMDLNQLKAEHPALFAEAVAVGVTQEHDRVEGHLALAEASGDMKLAVSCINEGKELTASISAQHTAAAIKQAQIEARGEESEEDLETKAAEEAGEHEDAVAKALATKMGVDIDE